MEFKLIWFDSYGAKSSCTLVETDQKIILDPGIAIMHPSFPASDEQKIKWLQEGYKEIIKYSKKANIIVISHYHWDHFLPNDLYIYKGKTIFVKDPNSWINDSQRERALSFYKSIFEYFGLEFKMKKPKKKQYRLPNLKSFEKDFGNYNRRRKELLEKGIKWFERRVRKWNSYEVIPELKHNNTKIRFVNNGTFSIGSTKIKFFGPFFHGIEFSRVGWIFSTLIEYKGEKLFYSSDVNGPIIEDYADIIIDLNPDYIILDGPPTYMIPYQMNLINLKRVIDNVKRIIDEVDFRLMIWDHHLPREKNFRRRTKDVWEFSKKKGRSVLTASEYSFNRKPVVENAS